MRLHRFMLTHEAGSLSRGEATIHDESLIHQIRKVFRLTIGDSIILCDGLGTDSVCEIVAFRKDELIARVIQNEPAWMPQKDVVLLLSHIKKDRFEWVLEKATEIGVTKIVPVVTTRTERGVVDPRRAYRIMTEASEQCGRGNVPHYGESISMHDAVTTPTVVMCDSTGISATDYFREHTESCAILIGPEGGFTTEEMKLCEDAHIPVLSFGQQTLRADTAAVVAATFALLK